MMGGDDNRVLMYAVILGAIFFFYLLPRIEKKYAKEDFEMIEKMTSLIKTKKDKILKIDRIKCSKDCCLHSQWPVPHMPENKNSKHVNTNLMCNGEGSGCVCLNKKQKNYLSERGKNYSKCDL